MLGRFVIFVDVIRNNITDSETPIKKTSERSFLSLQLYYVGL